MSDRSPLQMFVYSVHESEEQAVLEVMEEEGLDLEWSDDDQGTSALVLGRRYGIDETPIGSSRDLATALLQRAPSAVFKLWQDPHYSTDGHFVAHVPGIGTYTTKCDSDGTPHTSVPDLITQLANAPAGITVHDWLAGPGTQVLGAAVLSALKPYEKEQLP
ncbi:hypothetical protein ACFVUW_28700 [Streptomyces xiamenensis]|uniref:hypothetical protein n=1 Tax=Streptomyces xiamenensis TaxID=408015 RepID=UPI0036E53213